MTATAANAEPINSGGATATMILGSPLICGDIRGRVAMVQFENGETYVLADKGFVVNRHPSITDNWDSDHLNSGN
jgi:hypothetical protein